jgi:hypothetical protein
VNVYSASKAVGNAGGPARAEDAFGVGLQWVDRCVYHAASETSGMCMHTSALAQQGAQRHTPPVADNPRAPTCHQLAIIDRDDRGNDRAALGAARASIRSARPTALEGLAIFGDLCG